MKFNRAIVLVFSERTGKFDARSSVLPSLFIRT